MFSQANKLWTTLVLPVTPDISQEKIFGDDAQYLWRAYINL